MKAGSVPGTTKTSISRPADVPRTTGPSNAIANASTGLSHAANAARIARSRSATSSGVTVPADASARRSASSGSMATCTPSCSPAPPVAACGAASQRMFVAGSFVGKIGRNAAAGAAVSRQRSVPDESRIQRMMPGLYRRDAGLGQGLLPVGGGPPAGPGAQGDT